MTPPESTLPAREKSVAMNPDLHRLQAYPFEKLKQLKSAVSPPGDKSSILLSIGEPKHAAPTFVLDKLRGSIGEVASYPATQGIIELRKTMAKWLEKRFTLQADSIKPEDNILPVSGTREALFAFTQAVINRDSDTKPCVLLPNPFYQIYEGAALLAGATPHYLPANEHNLLPDFDAVDDDTWAQCQLLFICSPYNPTGAVLSIETLQKLIQLSDKHDFVIASDECYSEIYLNEEQKPVGLLEACARLGRHDYRRCVVFHSLSKRSNLPGLRSGFVAGDADIIKPFLLYRTYQGCAMPLHHQLSSIAAWSDEEHVRENRSLYCNKFTAMKKILAGQLELSLPAGAFYFWAKTPIDDIDFAQQLYAQQNVTVLPGQYLSRTVKGINPGKNRIRMALVASPAECEEAACRIKAFMETLI